MPTDGSVSHWISLLQAGDAAAAQPLWERYFRRLVGLAHGRLRGRAGGAHDAEDVALSAFDSFCRQAAGGRFPQLADRDSLWRLLVVITARKAVHLVRDEQRRKRGGGHERIDSAREEFELDQVLGQEPTPEFAALVAEEYRRLLDLLGSAELEAVAVAKMEGYTTAEVANQLGCAPRTVERRLRLIRAIWGEEIVHE
jgi:DNA-directed RNA polymerase specialized sigma24 family protein